MDKGENNNEQICDKMFYLSLKTMSWSLLRTRGDEVFLRDEHTAVYDEESTQMIVFGGFVQGTRVNIISIYNFTTNSWKNVLYERGVRLPCPRSGHQAVITQGNMYVFGGKNDDSEKMNDLWVFNIADERWTELKAAGDIPFERSGHSISVIGDNIIVFGGIWDVTKELNDLHCYSITRNTWSTFNDSSNQEQIENSPTRLKDGSPLLGSQSAAMKAAEQSPHSPTREFDGSPTRFGRSVTKRFKDSSIVKTKQSNKKRSTGGQGLRPMNTLAQLQKTQSLKYEGPIKLDSPASTMMKGSFLIKNHDVSNFDQYY